MPDESHGRRNGMSAGTRADVDGPSPLPPADPRFIGQDFTDHLSHRRRDGTEQNSVLRLAADLGVMVRETVFEFEDAVVRGLLIRRASPLEPSAAVVFVHGGGHMFGDAYSQTHELVHWAAELGIIVLSVDYRRSPEHPYPAAHDDVASALGWVRANARHLGVQEESIFLYGTSAGGGIAAGVTIAEIAQGRGLAGVLLSSPMLDHRTSRLRMKADGREIFTWNHENNFHAWSAYLGALADDSAVPGLASPGSLDVLPAFPPTYIDVGTHDLFLAEVLAFAQKARDAGTSVTCRTWDGAYHGFETLAPATDAARRSLRQRRVWLLERLLDGRVFPASP